MSTSTARLGLLKPDRTDQFLTSDIANNWAKIDQYPGYYVCASSARPTWGTGQAGMWISETDTGLLWRWTGSVWVRGYPSGRLKTTAGAYSYATRGGSLFSTTSTTVYVVALSVLNVVVPDGVRPLRIEATWDNAVNSAGYFFALVARSATAGGTTVGTVRQVAAGEGGSHAVEEPSGLATGTYSYSYQVKAVAGGTAQLSGLTLSVTEV